MPRFRLLQPHVVTLGPQGAVLLEAGAEIDSETLPASFRPSPLMAPLDAAAQTMLDEIIAGIRENAGTVSVPVIGPMHAMPGGDVYEAEKERADRRREAADKEILSA